MLWFKKKSVPETNDTKEIEVVQLWYVRWESRHGSYSFDTKKEMEGFTSEAEAREFAASLNAANKLLKNTNFKQATVEKN